MRDMNRIVRETEKEWQTIRKQKKEIKAARSVLVPEKKINTKNEMDKRVKMTKLGENKGKILRQLSYLMFEFRSLH